VHSFSSASSHNVGVVNFGWCPGSRRSVHVTRFGFPQRSNLKYSSVLWWHRGTIHATIARRRVALACTLTSDKCCKTVCRVCPYYMHTSTIYSSAPTPPPTPPPPPPPTPPTPPGEIKQEGHLLVVSPVHGSLVTASILRPRIARSKSSPGLAARFLVHAKPTLAALLTPTPGRHPATCAPTTCIRPQPAAASLGGVSCGECRSFLSAKFV
jgi:hypothetical protein